MSRTTRAVRHDAYVKIREGDDALADWAVRYNTRLGRDGAFHSPVYDPYKHAPGFLDRWRIDGVEGPNLKRHAKRELRRLLRRDGVKRIARALIEMGGAR